MKKDNALLTIFRYSLPAMLLLLIYFTFRMELAEIFDQLYADSKVLLVPESQINSGHVQFNSDILKFKDIWLLNYSFLFLAVLSFVNIRRFKSAVLGNINLILNAMIIIVFLSEGLSVLSSLRESYLNQNLAHSPRSQACASIPHEVVPYRCSCSW